MSKAGKIISIRLNEHTMTNRKTGEVYSNFQNGYVCYEDVKQAQKCIQMFDESNCFGFGKKPIKIDFWQSKFDLKN